MGTIVNWNETRPEDVLRETLDRVLELNKQLPCKENLHVADNIRKAIGWEEVRNERRKKQGVAGTWRQHKDICEKG